MTLASTVQGFIRYGGGLSGLSRVALGSMKPLDFHIFMISKDAQTLPARTPEGAKMYEDALERLQKKRRAIDGLPNEFWRDKINGASRCALLEVNEELASIVWVYESPAKRPHLLLGPTDAEFSATYTLAQFRGRGFHRALLAFATAWQLRERSRIFMVAASDNPAPLKVIPEAGFKEIAVIRRCSLYGPKFIAAEMRIRPIFEPS